MCLGSAGMAMIGGGMIFPDDGQSQWFISWNIETISVPLSIAIFGTFRQGDKVGMSYPLFQYRKFVIWKWVSLIGFCP